MELAEFDQKKKKKRNEIIDLIWTSMNQLSYKLKNTVNFLSLKKSPQSKGQLILPNLYNKVINQWNSTPNNQYTPPAITLADWHKYFLLKLVFGEHILQISIDIKRK